MTNENSLAAGYERAHQRGVTAERERIRKLALEPSEEMAQRTYDRIHERMPLPGLTNPNGAALLIFGVLFLRAFAEEIEP